MKKLWMIGAIAVALVTVLALGYTGWAYAQGEVTECPFCEGSGFMGGRGGFRGRIAAGEYGPLHDYMLPALANAFGLTPDALEAAHDDGKTLWEIAQDQGRSLEEFQALMLEARAQAFEQAVADGVISQEQASWMLERMNGGQFGGGQGRIAPGSCGMYGGDYSGQYGPGMRSGGRWNNQP